MFLTLALMGSLQPLPARSQTNENADRVLDQAIETIGGLTALEQISSIRLDLITQWTSLHFGDHPFGGTVSLERHSDLRNYSTGSWRNTRTFTLLGVGAAVTDVVRDTIGGRTQPGPNGPHEVPLNIAYVVERRELFAFAPERMLLQGRRAADRRRLMDTTIDGTVHARIAATIDAFPAVMFLRLPDFLPSMVRFVADETNDFGLAPWGVQEIEFWYAAWRRQTGGVLLPFQRDVRRMGKTYKRMTVLRLELNPPAPADSFAIAATTVQAYFETQRRPMWQFEIDSVKLVDSGLVAFPQAAGASGAVRLADGWLIFESGQAAESWDLLLAGIARLEPAARILGTVVTWPVGNGGLRQAARNGVPVWIAPPAAKGYGASLLGQQSVMRNVPTARWLRLGQDSVWVEPVWADGGEGNLAIYVPRYRLLYYAAGVAPFGRAQREAVAQRLRARGMIVDRVGDRAAFGAAVGR
jgi:hypothetical protein